jgi:hypothetical protein
MSNERPRIILCGPRLYEYKGWFFEESAYNGPWPLKGGGDPYKRAGRKFYAMWTEFDKLGPEGKKKYRVGGGCQFL